MTTLTGRLISNTYKQLIKIGVSTNTGITSSLVTIQDGDGSATALQLATSAAKIDGTLFVGQTFGVSGDASVAGNLAIANKETLVAAGKIFIDKSKEKNVQILPVDSEHSAIFQCLNNKNISNLDYITLTASGGPFLNTPLKEFKNIKPQDAIRHPVWKMGKKISVDSATMINKALEIIEASVLFNLSSNKIDVLVHPEHIIHGLVHYKDGSVLSRIHI